MEKLEQLSTYLELSQIDSLPQLKIVQEKTTLKPSILLILLSAFLLLLSIFIDLSPIILTIVAVIIPGYFTFQVIGTKVEREYIKYIIYWISFGLMEITLKPVVTLIFGNFFFIIIQTVLVIALLHPKFNMSLILYDRVIRVYVLKEEAIKNKEEQKSKTQEQTQNKPEEQPKPQQSEEVFIGASPVKESSDF